MYTLHQYCTLWVAILYSCGIWYKQGLGSRVEWENCWNHKNNLKGRSSCWQNCWGAILNTFKVWTDITPEPSSIKTLQSNDFYIQLIIVPRCRKKIRHYVFSSSQSLQPLFNLMWHVIGPPLQQLHPMQCEVWRTWMWCVWQRWHFIGGMLQHWMLPFIWWVFNNVLWYWYHFGYWYWYCNCNFFLKQYLA